VLGCTTVAFLFICFAPLFVQVTLVAIWCTHCLLSVGAGVAHPALPRGRFQVVCVLALLSFAPYPVAFLRRPSVAAMLLDSRMWLQRKVGVGGAAPDATVSSHALLPFLPVCPWGEETPFTNSSAEFCPRLSWGEASSQRSLATPKPELPFPGGILAWRARYLPHRTLLMLALIHMPRTAAFVALSRGETDTLTALLGAKGMVDARSAARTTLRVAAFHLLLPRTAQAWMCISAAMSKESMHWAVVWGCMAVLLQLRGVLNTVSMPERLYKAIQNPSASFWRLLSNIFSQSLLMAGLYIGLPYLRFLCAPLLLLSLSAAAYRLARDEEPLWGYLQDYRRLGGFVRVEFNRIPDIHQHAMFAASMATATANMAAANMVVANMAVQLHQGGYDHMQRQRRPKPDKVSFPPPLSLPAHADTDAPAHLRCPITLCCPREPAVSCAGITYERTALVRWVEEHGTEPSSRRPMKLSSIAPNYLARAALEAWAAKHPLARSAMENGTTAAADSSPSELPQPPQPPPPHAESEPVFEPTSPIVFVPGRAGAHRRTTAARGAPVRRR
jgi:hypothetical protein